MSLKIQLVWWIVSTSFDFVLVMVFKYYSYAMGMIWERGVVWWIVCDVLHSI